MKNPTSSSARTWGTLLVAIAVSFASLGTASAQQERGPGSSSWRQRESAAADRLARAAAERMQAEEAAQNEAIERGLAEQARQQRVLEEQAWARALVQVRQEQGERTSASAPKRFVGQGRRDVRAELSRHAQRKAFLVRLRELAVDEPLILGRVEALFAREQRLHQSTLARLGVTRG